MQYFHHYCFLFVTIYNQAFVAFKFLVTKVNFVTKEPRFGRFLEKKFIFHHYSILLVIKCDFVTKIIKCKTIIIFSDDYFSSLILPYSDENLFITNTIHRNTYSDEIFHH